MTAPRSTKVHHLYQRQRRTSRAQGDGCPFCLMSNIDVNHIEETSFFKVIRNSAPYSIWDSQGVKSHLLIIPKQHTEKLGGLGDDAAIEFLQLINKYEEQGYNMFARAPLSQLKSVAHQHTHLIQPDNKHSNFILYLRKPFYLRLSK